MRLKQFRDPQDGRHSVAFALLSVQLSFVHQRERPENNVLRSCPVSTAKMSGWTVVVGGTLFDRN